MQDQTFRYSVNGMTEKKGLSINQKTIAIIGVILAVAFVAGAWYMTRPTTKEQIIVSTTTSFYETGFLDVLKKNFEAKYSQYNVSFISQGTGLAIETAKKGNADLILVHDPAAEKAFLTDGYGVNRKIVAYNFFILVGPSSDPAGIKGLTPVEAIKKIAAEGAKGNATWVSRGDNSGTHSKEKALWKLAGLNVTLLKRETTPDGKPWYYEAGAGMTATLQLADQKNAYTITDMASYLKNSASGNIKLVKVVDAGKDTLNVYSAIVCNPSKNTRGHYEASMTFVKYLASDEGQALFKTFGVTQYGQALFKPWISMLKNNSDPDLIQWVKDYAYIDGSDCPTANRLNPGDLYS
jgi:tungstate transport system substrate-binding protein